MIFLIKLPSKLVLCHKGTTDPIIFDDRREAQSWLDNNEHQENDFELAECDSRETLLKYVRGEISPH